MRMHRFVLLIGLMTHAGLATAQAADPTRPVKVFILAGQSNMEGQAVADLTGKDYNEGKGTLDALLHDPAKAGLAKHLKTAAGDWAVREDVWVRYQPENGPAKIGPLTLGFTPYGGRHHFGPELQFGHVVADRLPNQILLIKTAWGGKSLYKDFRPPSSGGDVGPYYTKMLQDVRTALENLGRDFPTYNGRGYDLAGFVWYQGWNDGVDPKRAIPEYEQNLVNLIKDVRKDLKAPNLPVAIGELTGPWVDAPGEWKTLRKAQAAAAAKPEFLGNVLFVETRDFVRPAKESPNPGHGHHEFGNAETYFLVGDALGKGMVKLLGAQGQQKTAPPAKNKTPEPPKPTSHTVKTIEGWSVRVDDRLLAAPNEEMGKQALRVLENKLRDITLVVPADKVKKLQAVPIVLDLSHGKLDSMQYHPGVGWLKANGYSPDLVKCVHIPKAVELTSKLVVNEQPWVILHELAHAYHDQVLDFDEPRIKQVYENYKKSGHGDKVLLYTGRRVKHYALTNPMEFFAEMTESYFGVNDFFPFNRAELKEAEPEIYNLMKQIWEEQPKGSEKSVAPIVPGLANKHPLTKPEAGRVLIAELRCTACHSPGNAAGLPERSAPDLSDVGSRVSPGFLKKMILSPAAAHPGTTMPALLGAETPERQEQIAAAVSHFLIASSPRKFSQVAVADADAAAGKTLFHTVGCIACHSPRDDGGKEVVREGAVSLAHASAKYSLPALEEFLFQPTRVRPSGRMPDMKLTPGEAKAIASYLLGKPSAEGTLAPREEQVALGKQFFQQLNCAACHKLGDVPAAKSTIALKDANALRGCLSRSPGKTPWFNLSDDQVQSIRAALPKFSEPAPDKSRLAMTLTAFNCIACHVRDDYGGVSPDLNQLFQTSEKELGDEARIPPPLTLAGAKLRPIALKKMLFDGDSVRPYMYTRMPQFGELNLRHVPDLLARMDSLKHFEFALPNSESDNRKERDRANEMRTAGRELVGDKGLSCIACHTFGGKSPNKQGIDLMTMYPRLQPAWFYQFMLNPAAFRPRTVMPTSWPGGVAVHKTILDGDANRQLEAIWYYLSLGTSAPDPSGIRTADTLLSVGDAAYTYRGRSSVAGYRGIAVGFPEKLSYAFNAETGALSAVWTGEFIRVDRGGQGSGAFKPAGKFAALAQDLAFYALPDEQAPWPLRPVTTKDAPVNPDPLYPKNRGYQFKGYYLDDAAIPTFMYRSGDLEIEDRSSAESSARKVRLVRTISFESPRRQTVWFRALTGKLEAESKQRYKTPDLRLTIPAAQPVLRPASGDKSGSELLLKLDIPPGKSALTFTYELLP